MRSGARHGDASSTIAFGVIAWIAFVTAASALSVEDVIIRSMLAWGALGVVPMGLRLIDDGGAIVRAARRLHAPAAIALCVALVCPVGAAAAGMALPWAMLCGLLGLFGLTRILGGTWRSADDAAVTLGSLLLPVGGAWAMAAAAGLRPMGFAEPIVTLTGVHFHFTGFAMPVIASAAIAATRHRRGALAIGWCIVASLTVSVPALAIGFVVSPLLEVVAAMVVFAAVLMTVGLMAAAARGAGMNQSARRAWAVAAASAVVAVGPALVYACCEWIGRPSIPIPVVAMTHGVLMAMGFSTFGLLGALIHKGHGHGDASDERCG